MRQCRGKLAGYWRFYFQALAIDRMRKAHFGTRQQQPVAIEMLGEVAVMAPFAIGRVADDRVGDVLQVAALLVSPAGDRIEFEQGVTAARVAVDCYR